LSLWPSKLGGAFVGDGNVHDHYTLANQDALEQFYGPSSVSAQGA
jgi:hypothetical protein